MIHRLLAVGVLLGTTYAAVISLPDAAPDRQAEHRQLERFAASSGFFSPSAALAADPGADQRPERRGFGIVRALGWVTMAVGAVIILSLLVIFIQAIPEIRRYLKIRNM